MLRAHDGAATGGRWSISGAFAACLAITVYIALRSDSLVEADFVETVGWTIFAAFGATLLFWPFLASFLLWLVLRRAGHHALCLQSRAGAALYGATFHLTAHLLVTENLGGAPATLALMPIAVGALWGSWLPVTVDDWQPPAGASPHP